MQEDDQIDLEPSPLSAEELAKMEEENRQELIAVLWEYCEDGYGSTKVDHLTR